MIAAAGEQFAFWFLIGCAAFLGLICLIVLFSDGFPHGPRR